MEINLFFHLFSELAYRRSRKGALRHASLGACIRAPRWPRYRSHHFLLDRGAHLQRHKKANEASTASFVCYPCGTVLPLEEDGCFPSCRRIARHTASGADTVLCSASAHSKLCRYSALLRERTPQAVPIQCSAPLGHKNSARADAAHYCGGGLALRAQAKLSALLQLRTCPHSHSMVPGGLDVMS